MLWLYFYFYFYFQILYLCSAENWRYAAKQFLKRYPEDVIAHCEFLNPFISSVLDDR